MSDLPKPTIDLNWLEITYVVSILKNRISWYDNASWVQIQVVEELIEKMEDIQHANRMRLTIPWER